MNPSHERRLDQDQQIKPDRPVFDVVDIELDARSHLVDGFRLAAMAVHLSPTGDPGFDLVAPVVTADQLRKLLIQLDGVGPRPNHRHAAEKNIEELRQLIKAGSA